MIRREINNLPDRSEVQLLRRYKRYATIRDRQWVSGPYGIVSMLRMYSLKQMRELTADLQASDYIWDVGQIKIRGIPDGLPYLIGRSI